MLGDELQPIRVHHFRMQFYTTILAFVYVNKIAISVARPFDRSNTVRWMFPSLQVIKFSTVRSVVNLINILCS